MKQLTIVAALCVLIAPSSAGQARENRVIKCSVGKARAAQSTGGAALVANVPRAMTPIDLNAVQMTDKGVIRSVLVEGLFARRTETDTIEVTARLVNCSKKPLQIDVRSSFMGADQFPSEPTSAWQRVFLPPFATGVYREQSMSRNVASYLIELRGADQRQFR